VNGDLRVRNYAYKDTPGSFWLASDLAFKKDVAPLSGALEHLLKLRGVEFSWRDPEKHGATTDRYKGFIAQEVEKVFPQWVMTTPDGTKAFNPIGLEALVVEALRELNAKCARLESELKNLRGQTGRKPAAAHEPKPADQGTPAAGRGNPRRGTKG
jgi:hypothetical protein